MYIFSVERGAGARKFALFWEGYQNFQSCQTQLSLNCCVRLSWGGFVVELWFWQKSVYKDMYILYIHRIWQQQQYLMFWPQVCTIGESHEWEGNYELERITLQHHLLHDFMVRSVDRNYDLLPLSEVQVFESELLVYWRTPSPPPCTDCIILDRLTCAPPPFFFFLKWEKYNWRYSHWKQLKHFAELYDIFESLSHL